MQNNSSSSIKKRDALARRGRSNRDDLLIDSLLPSGRRRLDFFNININTRVYTSLAILRSHVQGESHLGTPCRPVTETIMVTRDNKNIGRWEHINRPPRYFERVEADANIYGAAYSASLFKRHAARMGLVAPLQQVILEFETLRRRCNSCMYKTYTQRIPVPGNWWPVGLAGANGDKFMDPSLLRTWTPPGRILNLSFMARQVFRISDAAFDRVLSKQTSLLHEVSAICQRWLAERSHLKTPKRVPVQYANYTSLIGPQENFLEVKVGVYYMLDRGTVIKFLPRPTCFTDFVIETAIGFSVDKNIKGAVGVTGTCPEAFCVEMDFAGVALQDVLNADLNSSINNPGGDGVGREIIQHHIAPSNAVGGLYGVRMLQATGRLPAELQSLCKQPITDSYSAIGVTNTMRKKLLDELPFVMAELVNIVTRLSQQGLVNPDIKSDNIVIDGLSGQPKMIDFGLAIPVGRKDTVRSVSTDDVYSNYPQTAPEYLAGERCQEAAMTYGLSYMITDMLNTLVTRTGDMAATSMSLNIPLVQFLAKAYAADYRQRPRAYLMSPLIGDCFPFKEHIASLFAHPKHTIIVK